MKLSIPTSRLQIDLSCSGAVHPTICYAGYTFICISTTAIATVNFSHFIQNTMVYILTLFTDISNLAMQAGYKTYTIIILHWR